MVVEVIKIAQNGIKRLENMISPNRVYTVYNNDDIQSVHITNFRSKNKNARPTLILAKDDYVFVDENYDVFEINGERILQALFSNKDNSLKMQLCDDGKPVEQKHYCPKCGKEAKGELRFSKNSKVYPMCDDCKTSLIANEWVDVQDFPGNGDLTDSNMDMCLYNRIMSNTNDKPEINKCPDCGVDIVKGGFNGKHVNLDCCPKCNKVFDNQESKWIDIIDAISKFVYCNNEDASLDVPVCDNSEIDVKAYDKIKLRGHRCLDCGFHDLEIRDIGHSKVAVCTSCGKAYELSKNGKLISIDDFSKYCMDKYNEQKELRIEKDVKYKGKCICDNDKFYETEDGYVCTECGANYDILDSGIYSYTKPHMFQSNINKDSRVVNITFDDYKRELARNVIRTLDIISLDIPTGLELYVSMIKYSIETFYGLGDEE